MRPLLCKLLMLMMESMEIEFLNWVSHIITKIYTRRSCVLIFKKVFSRLCLSCLHFFNYWIIIIAHILLKTFCPDASFTVTTFILPAKHVLFLKHSSLLKCLIRRPARERSGWHKPLEREILWSSVGGDNK